MTFLKCWISLQRIVHQSENRKKKKTLWLQQLHLQHVKALNFQSVPSHHVVLYILVWKYMHGYTSFSVAILPFQFHGFCFSYSKIVDQFRKLVDRLCGNAWGLKSHQDPLSCKRKNWSVRCGPAIEMDADQDEST